MQLDLAKTHPFDPAVLESPWAYYRALRERAPVFRDPFTGIFHVASYDLVLEALRDFETFSNRFAPAMGGGALAGIAADAELLEMSQKSYPGVDTMLTADPPEHTRFRGLVNKAFTPRRVEGLEQGIAQAGRRADRPLRRRRPLRGALAVLGAAAAHGDRGPARRAARRPAEVQALDATASRRSSAGMISGSAPSSARESHRRVPALLRRDASRSARQRAAGGHHLGSRARAARGRARRSTCRRCSRSSSSSSSRATRRPRRIAEAPMLLVQNPDQLALVREDPR